VESPEWAVVQLMGGRRFAGSLRRGSTIEVTVPATPSNPSFVKEFGRGAIYAITPCSESVARRAAEVIHGKNRVAPHNEGCAVPVFDPDCLNIVPDPMSEIDLDAARRGELRREWEDAEAAATANSEPF
jgi:hypothetical protein